MTTVRLQTVPMHLSSQHGKSTPNKTPIGPATTTTTTWTNKKKIWKIDFRHISNPVCNFYFGFLLANHHWIYHVHRLCIQLILFDTHLLPAAFPFHVFQNTATTNDGPHVLLDRCLCVFGSFNRIVLFTHTRARLARNVLFHFARRIVPETIE